MIISAIISCTFSASHISSKGQTVKASPRNAFKTEVTTKPYFAWLGFHWAITSQGGKATVKASPRNSFNTWAINSLGTPLGYKFTGKEYQLNHPLPGWDFTGKESQPNLHLKHQLDGQKGCLHTLMTSLITSSTFIVKCIEYTLVKDCLTTASV